jgi:hypothetical protein
MGDNEFGCISQLTRDVAWSACPLPQPPMQALLQLDRAFITSLAGNVSATVALVRRCSYASFANVPDAACITVLI